MRLALVLALSVIVLACGGEASQDDPAPPDSPAPAATFDRSTPEALAASIFRAAATGDFSGLEAVAAFGSDGDAKDVAGVASASAEAQAEFRKFFGEGKVVGAPRIEGDQAEVDVLIGPGATREETLQMVKEDGLWALAGF